MIGIPSSLLLLAWLHSVKLAERVAAEDIFFLLLQINGSTPDACWDKIYRKIRKMQDGNSNGFSAESGGGRKLKSGSDMFGFSNPEVIKLLKVRILVFNNLKIFNGWPILY